MDTAAKRTVVRLRVDIYREEQAYSDDARPLDGHTAAQIVDQADAFAVRLKHYLRQVGAIDG